MNLIQISYASTAFPVVLTGGGALAGFGRAAMRPAAGPGALVEQLIEIEFSGTQAQIESGMRNLGELLAAAEAQAAQPSGALVYLECQLAAADPLWRSPIYSGWLEANEQGIDQRPVGNQGARLHLVRANWWERSEELTLAAPTAITNHRDAGHSNAVYSPGSPHEEDLPAQARVVTALTTQVTAPAAVFVGMRSGNPGSLDLFYEGQDGAARAGVAGSTVSDANSSDDSYFNLAWSGAAETALWQVELASAPQLALAAGKPFRVVVRLADGNPTTASERLWVCWAVAYVDAGGAERVLYESSGSYLPNSNELILGPVLYLPPWIAGGAAPQLRVILKAAAAGTGAHALKLDYVDFCPLDGWRYYEPILQSYGVSVNDWGQNGVAGPVDGVMTHSLEGPGFLLEPGLAKQFFVYFALREAAEGSAGANLAGTLAVYFRPRKRVL